VQVEEQAAGLRIALVVQIGHGRGIVPDRVAIGFDEHAHGIANRLVVVHNANRVAAMHRSKTIHNSPDIPERNRAATRHRVRSSVQDDTDSYVFENT
jgi:hypothetical protein